MTVERESVSQDQTDFSALARESRRHGRRLPAVADRRQRAVFGKQLEEQGKGASSSARTASTRRTTSSSPAPTSRRSRPTSRGSTTRRSRSSRTAFEAEYGEFGTFGPPTFAATTGRDGGGQGPCAAGKSRPQGDASTRCGRRTCRRRSSGSRSRSTDTGDIEDAEFYIFKIADDGSYTLVRS